MDKPLIQKVEAHDPQFTRTRKVSLYANFARLKEDNPEGYDANIEAWQGLLLAAGRAGAFPDRTVIPAGPELIGAFTDAQNGVPVALNTVIDESVAQGKLVPLAKFLNASYPLLSRSYLSGKQWAATATHWVLSKVMDTAWHSGAVGSLKPIEYVEPELLKPVASNLLRTLKRMHLDGSYSSSVFSTAQAQHASGLNETDLQCSLIYLSRETGLIAYDRKAGLLKLDGPLNSEDAAIPGLRDQLAKLDARMESLEQDMRRLDLRARAAVADGRRPVAKDALRRRAQVAKVHEQAMAAQSQLAMVLAKIDEATDQQRVVEALEQGKELLAARNKAVGGADKVHELMDELHENVGETEAVSAALAGLSLGDEAEAEVDQELADLEAAVAGKDPAYEAASKRLAELSVPKRRLDGEPAEAEPRSTSGRLHA